MIEKSLIDKLKDFGLNCAEKFLGEKNLQESVELHSIAIMGGWARCYFNPEDRIENHRDIDIDIYFSPKAEKMGATCRKVNTQGYPTRIKNYYAGKDLDMARIALQEPKSPDFAGDVRAYIRPRKYKKRMSRRAGSPMIFIYPALVPVKEL